MNNSIKQFIANANYSLDDKMKTFIIGPIPPYRGGIAHSNAILCRNLSRNNEVKVLSFSRLFPSFLYPGKWQKEKNRKPEEEIDIEFVVDSINPLNWVNVFFKIRREKPELVCILWWTTFLTPCYLAIALLTKFFTKTRVSVLCHNVTPHDENRIVKILDCLLTKLFFSTADYFVTFSKSDKEEVKRMLPKADVRHIIEPTYDEAIEDTGISKQEAKKKIGVNGNSILFFGFVRPYKGLDYLLEAMPAILRKTDLTLIIAGEFWKGKEQHVNKIKKLGIEKNVKIFDKYLPDKEVINYFRACEAVVLPYTSSNESGITRLAFGFGCPVITTRSGANAEHIKHGKNGLLVPPKNSEKLAEAVISYYKNSMYPEFKKEVLKGKGIFEWNTEKEKLFLGKDHRRNM